MLPDKSRKPRQLYSSESTAALKSNGIQPGLRVVLIPFYMHVPRFAPVAGVEEEPIRTDTEHRRHGER